MHDTCTIHGIRILITNPPKLDKTITNPTSPPFGGRASGCLSTPPTPSATTAAPAPSTQTASTAPTAPTAARDSRLLRQSARRDVQLGFRRHGSHHLCSTPSSCDGIEHVFAFPTGEARHRARRCTQVRCRRRFQRRPDGHGSNRKRRRIARRCGTASEQNRGRRRWRHCLHAPRPAI